MVLYIYRQLIMEHPSKFHEIRVQGDYERHIMAEQLRINLQVLRYLVNHDRDFIRQNVLSKTYLVLFQFIEAFQISYRPFPEYRLVLPRRRILL